jgi:hypothetical protein
VQLDTDLFLTSTDTFISDIHGTNSILQTCTMLSFVMTLVQEEKIHVGLGVGREMTGYRIKIDCTCRRDRDDRL